MGKVFAVGVGPGSQNYITEIVRKIIVGADVIVGHKYTLDIISSLIQDKKIHIITMEDQEKTYQQIKKELGDGVLVVPFTGDVNFSESEVVDRLIEVFGEVEIIPGISSVQVAASKAKIPLDKSKVITMHVTTSIEEKKIELQKAVLDGFNTSKIPVHVFESLTNGKEQTFTGSVQELEGKEFSDLSVMVISQTRPESYINF